MDQPLNELLEEVFQNLHGFQNMSAKEYVLYNKYYECVDVFENYEEQLINNVYHDLMSFEDVEQFMSNDTNKIDILLAEGNFLEKDWIVARKLVHSMPYIQNPGRNVKFLIKINDKIAGVVSLASDMMELRERNEYIGWSRDDRLFGKNNLTNTAACSTIMPVQPLGYLCAGGKLISLLLFHQIIRDVWKSRYENELVGLTTTSLYGIENSQYNGMRKYWRPCGQTTGKTPLMPQAGIYRKMIAWLREYHEEEYQSIFEIRTNSKGEEFRLSTPKNHVVNLFYSKTGFRDFVSDKGIKPDDFLNLGYQRGVYFARFYENTNEFLCNNVKAEDLHIRQNLDFDVSNANDIVNYWKRKWASRRWNKMLVNIKNEDKSKFMMHLKGIDSVEEFIGKYTNYDTSQEDLEDVFSDWMDLFT